MKKRKEEAVKTSTLIILLTISFVIWMIILIGFVGIETTIFLKVIATVIIYIFYSIILSLLTVSIIAMILQWKI